MLVQGVASVERMLRKADKELRVKFMGGREVVGILKGYDALLNLVLDETREYQIREEGLTKADVTNYDEVRGQIAHALAELDWVAHLSSDHSSSVSCSCGWLRRYGRRHTLCRTARWGPTQRGPKISPADFP